MEYVIYDEGILIGCFADEKIRDLCIEALAKIFPDNEYNKGILREDEA